MNDQRTTGEPETAETAAHQPDGSAVSPATRSRRQIDGSALSKQLCVIPSCSNDRLEDSDYCYWHAQEFPEPPSARLEALPSKKQAVYVDHLRAAIAYITNRCGWAGIMAPDREVLEELVDHLSADPLVGETKAGLHVTDSGTLTRSVRDIVEARRLGKISSKELHEMVYGGSSGETEPDVSGPDHPRQQATMSLLSPSGTKVQYMDCNGWPGDTAHCRQAGLIKDQIYEVVEIDVHDSWSGVRLKGFEGQRFNTVCFCSVVNGSGDGT